MIFVLRFQHTCISTWLGTAYVGRRVLDTACVLAIRSVQRAVQRSVVCNSVSVSPQVINMSCTNFRKLPILSQHPRRLEGHIFPSNQHFFLPLIHCSSRGSAPVSAI